MPYQQNGADIMPSVFIATPACRAALFR
jgi:hypothetical protein